uniref:Dipeptidase n=1 Tax=Haptolina brevifila TaxID=156173 RepID=A0A7S2N574_9EUKA
MEGFSIADATETWYMEMIGKGKWGKGVVWVALRVPDGYISAHANQARITTFLPCNPSDCMAAPDVVSFAIERGYFKGAKDDPNFSFSDTYDPVTFEGARFCEARVFSIFTAIAHPDDFNPNEHLEYARGYDLTKRMPLFVRPREKLDREKMHTLMSNHYQDTWFDPSVDVGAGAEHTPYRWNGLIWEYDGKSYVNERVVGVHYTGWHFVAHVGSEDVPKQMRALMYWGADDHSYSPKIPLHGGADAVHSSYDDAQCTGRATCRATAGLPGNVMNFSWDSAWWVNNAVADTVYTRKDRAAPVVLAAREALDKELDAALKTAEAAASAAFKAGNIAEGKQVLTAHAMAAGALATATWRELWQRLMTSFIDGSIKTASKGGTEDCGCTSEHVSYTDAWKTKVVTDAGEHYRVPSSTLQAPRAQHDKPPISKMKVKGVIF